MAATLHVNDKEATVQTYRFRALVKFSDKNNPTIFEGDFYGYIDDEVSPMIGVKDYDHFQRAFDSFKKVIKDQDGEIITILDVKLRHTSDVLTTK